MSKSDRSDNKMKVYNYHRSSISDEYRSESGFQTYKYKPSTITELSSDDVSSFEKGTRSDRRSFNRFRREQSSADSFPLSAISKVILFIVVGIPFLQYLFVGNVSLFDLDSILNMFSTAPQVSLDWLSIFTEVKVPSISGDWGSFNFLLDFFNLFPAILNSLVGQLSFIGWIGTGLVNCALFIIHFYVSIFGA